MAATIRQMAARIVCNSMSNRSDYDCSISFGPWEVAHCFTCEISLECIITNHVWGDLWAPDVTAFVKLFVVLGPRHDFRYILC